MQASFIGRTDTVCALLSAGANIDMQDGVRCRICVSCCRVFV